MPHGFIHALGNSGAHQDLAHEDVKRDGQEDRVVAGRPADFAKGADQRHRGILIGQNETENPHGGGDGNRRSHQDEKPE